MIYACGQGTDNPVVTNMYEDKSAIRGFDYYYYVVTVDNGFVNTIDEGVQIESSLFWTRTIEPATLTRQPGTSLDGIRIVPNPYNISALSYQFGSVTQDRLMFYGLPPKCTIKIFTERGDLIKTIHHTDSSGDEAWDSLTSSGQIIVSGIYIAYIEVTVDSENFKKGESTYKKLIIVR
jgi:hypothetical protein